jgi:hypothetical protein
MSYGSFYLIHILKKYWDEKIINAKMQARDDDNNMTSEEITKKKGNRTNETWLITVHHGSSPKLKSLQDLSISIKA